MQEERCGKVVLVVDDDAAIRDTLTELLAEEGYEAIAAADGSIALQRLRELDHKPCVILLDLMMPNMNGPQFFQEQQKDPELARIPVVLISADAQLKQKSSAYGGEFIPKPMRIERVLEVVQRHCA